MLLEQVGLLSLFGLLTALVMDMIVIEGKRPFFTIFMMVQGAFFGWFAGMAWTYITKGLMIDVFALCLAVIVSGFFSAMILLFFPSRITGRVTRIGSQTTVISAVVLLGLCCLMAFLSVPPAGISAMNTEQFVIEDLPWTTGVTDIVAEDIVDFSASNINAIPMTITYAKSSITGLKLMEDPASDTDYMDFQVSMKVDGTWTKPYLKLAVFEDKDGDRWLSPGDKLWADTTYKVVVGNDDGLWRSNCVWQDGNPVASAFVADSIILPIFHASSISQWKNEESVAFMNTPETYIPEYDMVSWEREDSKITLKEEVISFGSISNAVTEVRGRLYTQGATAGSHYILVQAFDASNTDPFKNDADPIASKLIPFEIAGAGLQSAFFGTEWGVFISLGAVVVVGVIIYTKEEWF